MIAKLLPRVFSSSGNMAAAGKRVFSPSAAILENEKILGKRLLPPKLYKIFYLDSNGIALNSVQCGRELEQLKGNEKWQNLLRKISRTKSWGVAPIHSRSPSLQSMKQDDTTVFLITASFWKLNPSIFVLIPATQNSRPLQGNDGRTLISQHEARQE